MRASLSVLTRVDPRKYPRFDKKQKIKNMLFFSIVICPLVSLLGILTPSGRKFHIGPYLIIYHIILYIYIYVCVYTDNLRLHIYIYIYNI